MKLEDLTALGLSDEQARAVMEAHGADVEAARSRADALDEQLAAARAGLGELDETRRQLDEARRALADSRKRIAIRDAMRAYRPRDPALVERLLDADAIRLDGNGAPLGAIEQLDALRRDSAYLFFGSADERGGSPDAGGVGAGMSMNDFLRGV